MLDVTFNEDRSRLRKDHGATNMAAVGHYAISLVRDTKDKCSIKTRRKCAAWDPTYLRAILEINLLTWTRCPAADRGRG
jgi:hypothetical protein